MRKVVLILAVLFLTVISARADVNNYNPYQGWFWYKNPPKKEKNKDKNKEEKFTMKTYTYKQLWNMYPDKFQKLLKYALRQAVQNPTPQNVKQYLILQDIARRKAYAFSNVVGYVTQTNPNLSLYKDYPENSPGIRMRTGLMNYDVDKTLKSNRDEYALLFFYKPGCQYCEIQSQILRYLQDEDGWEIMPININQRYDVAARFNVKTVPEIILIHKGSPQWIPVAAGVIALNNIKRNIYRGIMYFEGKLNPKNWSIYQFQKNSGFDVDKYPVAPDMKFKIKVEEQ
ncbi:conjugal transfer protein TraF [Hippea maritima]|uniref:Glutaredoxin 2 n=1 Tax=Hippea maritima (strain ATCC 700847 / DSM 10411 / MH2) TaxID=760142 RepID=F2LV33_HIPMA|nr:conjugal transfer protein TraF [Hippea maritima]AEA33617.1 glutaredoxin 2 [Hippea maritima DSM 10411]